MLRTVTSRVLIAEDDAVVAAHLAGQLVREGYEVVPVFAAGEVIGHVLAGGVDVVVLDLPDAEDVLRDLPDAGFSGGVVLIDVPTGPGEVTSTALDAAHEGRPVLLLHHLDHLKSAVEQVLELSRAGTTDGREELDVAATVAWALSQHAPGTHVAGPTTGGVQVVVATLDPEAFDTLLLAMAELVGVGSTVRLEHDGGKVRLAVSGARPDTMGLIRVREAAVEMGGTVLLKGADDDAFTVELPVGLSVWE